MSPPRPAGTARPAADLPHRQHRQRHRGPLQLHLRPRVRVADRRQGPLPQQRQRHQRDLKTMRLTYHTLDVFTEQRFGGNPLAVFPDAERLEQEGEGGGKLMQRIATELNLSETVFVLPAKTTQGTKRVRIFTPVVRCPSRATPPSAPRSCSPPS